MLRHMAAGYTGLARTVAARCDRRGRDGACLRPAMIVLAVVAGLAIGARRRRRAQPAGLGSVAGAARAARRRTCRRASAIDIGGAVALPRLPGERQPDGRARGRLGQRQRDLERGPRRARRDDPDVRLRPGGPRPQRRPAETHTLARCGRGPAGAARRGRRSRALRHRRPLARRRRTPACSPATYRGRRRRARCSSTPSSPTSRTTGSTRSSARSSPSTRRQLDGLRAHVSQRRRARLAGQRGAAPGSRRSRASRSRCSWQPATSRAWTRRRTR